MRVRRAWPGPPGAEGDLVVEVITAAGEVRGGTWPAGAPGPEVPEDDPSLPALAAWRDRPGARVLGHRAGRRAVLLVPGVGFVKLARPSATRRALDRDAAVRAALAGVAGAGAGGGGAPVVLPAVLAARPEVGELVLAPLAGRPLTDVLVDGGAASAASAGDALGALLAVMARAGGVGGGPRATLPERTARQEVDTTGEWVDRAERAGALTPAEVARLRARLAAAAEEVLALAPRAPGLSHRDLHDGQVLVPPAGGPPGVLDWDTAAWADPALDVANLLAHTDLLAALHPGAALTAPVFEAAVLARCAEGGAAAGAGGGADRGAVAAHRRLTAVRLRAVHAFRPHPRVVAAALDA